MAAGADLIAFGPPPATTERRPQHGLRSEYRNHGCRCEACRAANAAYQRAYMKSRYRPSSRWGAKDGGYTFQPPR